ncbi:hypothetical protein BGZ73_001847 [Actinomortierella ambigua]|nr:hypothetical protein BGZ73_001847 [Actinomortierella ambigua]
MVASLFDVAATASVATSARLFAITSPTSANTASAFERLDRKATVLNANADPFHQIQEQAVDASAPVSVLTTSDTLLPAIPHLFKIASQRSAVVVHVEPRERDQVPSLADLMAVRQTGFGILTSDNAQTAYDLALVAQQASVQTSTPFFNVIQQSTTSLDSVKNIAPTAALDKITEQDLTEHKDRQQALGEVSLSSLYLNPKDKALSTEQQQSVLAASPKEVFAKVEELLATLQSHTGRAYRAIEYKGPANPKTVFVSLAAGSSQLENLVHKHHAKDTGLIKVHLYRPWSAHHFLQVLPASVERVVVYEQAPTVNTAWTPLFLDVSASFHSGEAWAGKDPKIISARYRGSGAELTEGNVKDALNNADKPVFVINPQYNVHPTAQSSPLTASDIDTPYIQMLNQVFGDRLNIENGLKSTSVWGAKENSPEFGYGALVTKVAARARFAELVSRTVQDASIALPEALRQALTKWHLNRSDAKLAERHGQEAQEQLEAIKAKAGSLQGTLAEIYAQRAQFAKASHWLVGADAWAFDIANSGVHHVISSNADINLLILDTEPYTERAKKNADYRKKDIGLYAMNYGSVYVASVAVYSSYSQVLHALIEADSYHGPSIVLAYLPHPTDQQSSTVSPITVLKETKLAIDTGYWPLYRWNPALDEQGQEPFRLDSERIKLDLQQFLERENHLSLLLAQKPELSRTLTNSVESEAKAREEALKAKAKADFAKLMGGLAGPPLLVLFASDGGNAEGLAKRVVKGAKLRNLNARMSAMDDVTIEDLTLEKHVIFIISTAGQGEFPVNGREFWKALSAATELGVSETKVAIFGLGDSHYWPREEDAIFYNRPAKDVYVKLVTELGAQSLIDLGLGDDQDPDSFETALWTALGCKPLEGVVDEPKKSADDAAKVASNFLRGTIAEGLLDESTGALAESDTKLTKFHGIYQQDDRDLREERKKQGLEKAFSFMVRVRVPGGVATPAQWLAMDSISDVTANGTLKLTTRQAFQFHGVLKRNLKKNIQLINKSLLDTLAACGDVNRNIMCNPNPHQSHLHKQVHDFSDRLSTHLLPRTSAYREIWLDEKLIKGEAVVDHEPLYGPTYLPRKFKIAVAVPPNNDVDVFAHDLGYIAITNDDGSLAGFNMTVGGGMGMTHGNKKTYPRVADLIAFVTPEQAIEAGEKVMLVQRDFGDRMNRKHARLKYTIDDRGIEWFKAELQARLPFQLEEPRPFKFVDNADRYGWTQSSDKPDIWHYCCYIENGRVKDTPAEPHKTGLREIAKIHKGEFRLTPNQHLIIANVPSAEKAKIQALLEKYKLDKLNYTGAMLNAMACVAFPTCGLAMAESERYLPALVTLLESTLEECGLRDDAITIRMTGCPNGCARPYVAEIAFVGKAYGVYNVYLGGGHHGQRLNKLYKESLTEDEIVAELKPMIKRYATERLDGEHFGDFVIRAGIIKETTAGKNFHDL